MVIYSDSLIHLEFDPKTDILKVKWPHLVDEPMLIVKPTINKILESVRYFNVTKMLVDTKDSNTNINEEDFKKLSQEFIGVLANSNLKKVARIIFAEPRRELRARILLDELAFRMGSGFQTKEFTNEKSAVAWLESEI